MLIIVRSRANEPVTIGAIVPGGKYDNKKVVAMEKPRFQVKEELIDNEK